MNTMLRGSISRCFATKRPRGARFLGAAPRLSRIAYRAPISRFSTLNFSSVCAARTRRLQAFKAPTAIRPYSLLPLPPRMNNSIPMYRRSVKGKIFDSMMAHPLAWLLIVLCVCGGIQWSCQFYNRMRPVYIAVAYVSSRWEGWKARRRHRRAEKLARREQAALEKKGRGERGGRWRDYFWAPRKRGGDGKDGEE